MRQLQSVQNAAALRLITGAKRREHITPILRQLHWLPVRRRVFLNSRWPAWYTKCCQAKYPAIWPTIFISPQKVVLAPSGSLRSATRVQSRFGDMFCCSWTTHLEQLTCQSARQGSQLHRIQKTTENIHVSDGLRRSVTFFDYCAL